ASTSTLNRSSTAAFTSGLVASCMTRKTTCECWSAICVAFSDTVGASSSVSSLGLVFHAGRFRRRPGGCFRRLLVGRFRRRLVGRLRGGLVGRLRRRFRGGLCSLFLRRLCRRLR